MSNYIRKIILLITLLCTQNITFCQDILPDEIIIDYSAIDKPLREVIFDLSVEADITIAFQDEIVPGDSLINFSVRTQPIGLVLDYLLSRHAVKYKIIGSQIVLYKDPYARSSSTLTISGYITDQENGESLVSANIYSYDKINGTNSNIYGFYSFTIPKGSQRLYYSYLGYNTRILDVELKNDTVINVQLDPNIILKEIVITDNRIINDNTQERDIANVEILSIDKIESFVTVGGEVDVLRMAYTKSGITSGSDGFGGMSVRGGSTNQNLILFDGVPVYNANHLFGLYSIFNSHVVKSAKVYKGAFPANYSGRLSSVLDVRTREGNMKEFGGEVAISLFAAKVALEGPIIKDRASYLFTARRSILDPFVNTLVAFQNPVGQESDTDLKFSDINLKVNFKLTDNSRLLFSHYTGKDVFNNKVTRNDSTRTIKNIDQLNWDSGNKLTSLKWNWRISQKLFVNTTVYRSQYQYLSFDLDRTNLLFPDGSLDLTNYTAGHYDARIVDQAIKIDFDLFPTSKQHEVSFDGAHIVFGGTRI